MHLHRWTPGWVNWEKCWCSTSLNIRYPVSIKVRQKISLLWHLSKIFLFSGILTAVPEKILHNSFVSTKETDFVREPFECTFSTNIYQEWLDRVCIMEMAYLFVTQEDESCSKIVIAFSNDATSNYSDMYPLVFRL